MCIKWPSIAKDNSGARHKTYHRRGQPHWGLVPSSPLWTRDQCITVAQLRTGHSPLVPICTVLDVETPPLVNIAMVLIRRQNIWCYTAQCIRLWSFLERIGVLTHPCDPSPREWKGEGAQDGRTPTLYSAWPGAVGVVEQPPLQQYKTPVDGAFWRGWGSDPSPREWKGESTRWQNTHTVQRTTRHGGSRGPTSTTKAIQDACGASWRGSGQWPVPCDMQWQSPAVTCTDWMTT